jgi:hypothetical protein
MSDAALPARGECAACAARRVAGRLPDGRGVCRYSYALWQDFGEVTPR